MTQILIGVISGIISGTGMGGGTILIFLLTNMLGVEQHIAQATNLVFFIPTSIIAIIINIKDQNVDLKLGTILAVYGILGAIIGANIAVKINVNILKKCFGIFLAIIAIHEIYDNINLYKKQKRRHNNKKY
ncbi:MAG: sulfite exporter TauE/SafE family protein [Clostridia bacterium]